MLRVRAFLWSDSTYNLYTSPLPNSIVQKKLKGGSETTNRVHSDSFWHVDDQKPWTLCWFYHTMEGSVNRNARGILPTISDWNRLQYVTHKRYWWHHKWCIMAANTRLRRKIGTGLSFQGSSSRRESVHAPKVVDRRLLHKFTDQDLRATVNIDYT